MEANTDSKTICIGSYFLTTDLNYFILHSFIHMFFLCAGLLWEGGLHLA